MKRKERSLSDPTEQPSISRAAPEASPCSDATSALDDALISVCDFDDTGEMEAASLNHFKLTNTFADALAISKENGVEFPPGEEYTDVFDLKHIVNALGLTPVPLFTSAFVNTPSVDGNADLHSSGTSGSPPSAARDTGLDNLETSGSSPSMSGHANSASPQPKRQAGNGQPSKKNKKKKIRAKTDLIKQAARRDKKIRGGFGRKEAANEAESQLSRQLRRNLRESVIFQQHRFSSLHNTSNAKTGWRGVMMPQKAYNKWRRDYLTGNLNDKVATFTPVPFTGKPTMIVDKDGRLFVYRTETIRFLDDPDAGKEISDAIDGLLGHVLSDPEAKKNREDEARGPHEPCIIGHQREYIEVPDLTKWHRLNKDRVDAFMANELIAKTTTFVNRTLEVMFPGVAARYRKCKNWYEQNNDADFKISPLFGLYWCLCINGIFNGQTRIHCLPHIDFKNLVGVCALLVYQLPGRSFDHETMCWLVLWEAEVAIQLPPWTVLLYPSSLLHHFNIDIRDFEFVVTNINVKKPTKENSKPLNPNGGDGRGSFVWFNQASQFIPPETGFTLLKKAAKAGKPTTTDYGKDAATAFPIHGTKVSMTPQ